MRIKSLELVGFKSFYDKTRIHFHSGINAVVGPNGCGKSNIIDAVRWVLGEQNPRLLRADSMEDIISNGSNSLKPLGMSEVSLVVEGLPNLSFDEVVIKRRLYRSGESEYSINGVKCRLKDITELFLDTGAGARGYSIIGQGKVEEFITAKPEDKRRLIEEVAGILKYKTRRKETQSRLESTRENLNRVSDMKKEVSRQMESLSRQAQDAEHYKKLSEDVRMLETNINSYKLFNFGEKKEKYDLKKVGIENKISSLNIQRAEKARELNSFEDINFNLDEKIQFLESEIFKNRSDINEKISYQEYVNKEVAGIEEYISKLKKEIALIEKEKEDINSSKLSKDRSLKEIASQKIELESELKEKENELAELKIESSNNRTELDKTKTILFDILDNYSSVKGSAVGINKELDELSLRKDRIKFNIDELVKERELIVSRKDDTESQLRTNEESRKNLEVEIDGYNSSLSSLTEKYKSKLQELTANKEKLNDCISKIEVLKRVQANYEWLPEATREFVLSRKGNGVLGIVSDFVQAPKNYEKALEAALGEKSNWVVVNQSSEALSAIETLRTSSVGRSTFIPLEEKNGSSIFNKNGFNAPLINELISINGVEEDLISSMLKGVFVVPTLNDAFEMKSRSDHSASFATMEGEFIDSCGAITGGFMSGGVFERKREIEDLDEQEKIFKERVGTLTSEADSANNEVIELDLKLSKSNEMIRNSEIVKVELKKDIVNLSSSIEDFDIRISKLKSDQVNIDAEIDAKKNKVDEIGKTLLKLEKEKEEVDERFGQFESIVKNFENREKIIEQDLTGLKVKTATIAENEKSIRNEIVELNSRDQRLANKIVEERDGINKKIEETEKLIVSSKNAKEEEASLSELLQTKETELTELKENRSASKENLSNVRVELNDIDQDISSTKEALSSLEVKLNSIEVELNHTKEEIQKLREGEELVTDITFTKENFERFDMGNATKELKSAKRKIDSFGLVNLLAPEEYKKLEERHDFLTEQTDDLEQAIDSLRKAMNKLDRESTTRFKEAFEIINEKFQEILSKLFVGGEGKLVITDPDDLLNTGIEVMVRPKGKRFQSINLLSGGEKALSAIALVISACLVKPVPFLLLDEIDAPLDESNTLRFVKLVHEIAKDSQVVVVTHNKTSMQDVDALIGITSDRSITSKVVSVELDAA